MHPSWPTGPSTCPHKTLECVLCSLRARIIITSPTCQFKVGAMGGLKNACDVDEYLARTRARRTGIPYHHHHDHYDHYDHPPETGSPCYTEARLAFNWSTVTPTSEVNFAPIMNAPPSLPTTSSASPACKRNRSRLTKNPLSLSTNKDWSDWNDVASLGTENKSTYTVQPDDTPVSRLRSTPVTAPFRQSYAGKAPHKPGNLYLIICTRMS